MSFTVSFAAWFVFRGGVGYFMAGSGVYREKEPLPTVVDS